jgi:membrane protein
MTGASGARMVTCVLEPTPTGSDGAEAGTGPGVGDEGRIDRLRRRAEGAARRATSTVDAARRRSATVDAAVRTYERDRETVGSVLAGAVAFRLFVFLLPLTLGVVTLLGALWSLDDTAPEDVGEQLGMTKYLIDSVNTAARQSQKALWVLVPLSLWAIYWGSRGVVKVLRAVHALAWRQPLTKVANSVAAALVALGLVIATGLMTAGLQLARHRSGGLGLGLALLGVLPFAGLWLVVSLLMPRDPRARWTALLPGAVLVGVAVWLAHLFSVYYLARQVDQASELYGSLGVAAALLAWLYLLSRVMVASAMLDAARWEQRQAARAAE